MIHLVFDFLRKELDSFLKTRAALEDGLVPDLEEGSPPKVAFLEFTADPAPIPNDRITLLLINMEQENHLRPPDLYQANRLNGESSKTYPPIRLNIIMLFVTKFGDYLESLKHLGAVVQFFQQNPVFTPQSFPNLPKNLGKLHIEFLSPSYTQQNEIWGALKTAYLPSVLLKAKMIVFQEPKMDLLPEIMDTEFQTKAGQS